MQLFAFNRLHIKRTVSDTTIILCRQTRSGKSRCKIIMNNLTLTLMLVALAGFCATVEASIAYKKPIIGKAHVVNAKYLKIKQENERKAFEISKNDGVVHKQIDLKSLEPISIQITHPLREGNTTETASVLINNQEMIKHANSTAKADADEDETIASASVINAVQTKPNEQAMPSPCTCGVFLTSQIARGQAQGSPVITYELDRMYPCNFVGKKQCQNKCLEKIVQHLPNAANILCASLNRDVRKERAYLFVKNCQQNWWNTGLTAGRDYCCKNGQPYACPLL